MYLIKVELAPSIVHGIGVFTKQFIPKNSEVWQFNPLFDLVFSSNLKELRNFPNFKALQKYIRFFAFLDKELNKYILSSDDSKYENHSYTPNLIVNSRGNMIAARDILPGEELTSNYFDYDLEAAYKLSIKTY